MEKPLGNGNGKAFRQCQWKSHNALSSNFSRGGPSNNQTDFPWDLPRANLSTHAAFPLFVPKCIMNCNVEVSNID